MKCTRLSALQESNVFALTTSTAVVLVATTAFIVYRSHIRNENSLTSSISSSWAVVPGKIPWIGNAWQIGSLSRLYEQLYVWADSYGRRRGAYEINIFGTTFVVVCRQDRILDLVTKHRPHKLVRSNKAKSVANGIGAKGLFSAEGNQWSIDRRLVAPALNRKNIRCSYHEYMKMVSRRLVNKWASFMKERPSQSASSSSDNGGKSRHNRRSNSCVLSIHNDLHSISIDILSLAVYGKDANSLEALSDQTSRDVMAILDLAMMRMFSPFAYWDIPLIGPYLDGGGWIKNRLVQALDQMISQQQELNNISEESEDASIARSRCNTFLSKILALNQESEDFMPRERLIGQLLTLFLGGSDSVGTVLTTAFWQLAADPELQNTLVQELLKMPDVADVRDATVEKMMKHLPRMRAFIMELLRCYGPLPIIFLAAAEDLDLGCGESKEQKQAFFIPRGAEVMLLTQYASTHPAAPPSEIPIGPNGEEPSEFCPQRWLVSGENTGKPGQSLVEFPTLQSGVHMAFGHGPRICPGKEFAELEVMTCITHVLQRFNIALEASPTNQQAPLQKIKFVLEER
ncbi:hypothetical protein ACA910_022569 [Epithemia clementina (nom. ined.)]